MLGSRPFARFGAGREVGQALVAGRGLANELGGLPQGEVSPCPPHVALEPIWKQAA